MLSELLSSLFGKKDPGQEIQQRLTENWSDWLAPISPDKPTGDDPTYTDNFQLIKEEIAKLSGIDTVLIAQTSEELLKTTSKDIRVATYYCWARLKMDGVDGFTDGIELIAGLLSRFATDLYPSREHIRKNSIEWLANAKFIEPLNRLHPIPEPALVRIIAALDLIKASTQTMFAQGDAPDLDALIRFFANSVQSPQKILSTETTKPVVHKVEPAEVRRDDNVTSTLRSQRDVLDQARRIAAFLREKPEGYLAAGRLLRTLRWDTVQMLPPSDNRGKTRLAAPRAEIKQHIQRLVIGQDWRELFERVEAAFMEGGNHFWLDLQRYAVLALQKMGLPYSDWAEIYLTDVGLMLDRLKGIERLTYDNGFPFADDETLNWIAVSATIHHIDSDSSLPPMALTSDDDNWHEIEQQAIELANQESLESAFKWLQGLPSLTSPKQRFLLRYTEARVAEYIGEKDIAFRLLAILNRQEDQISLLQWESDLWFDIKAHLLKLLKHKLQLKDSDKAAIMQQMEQISSDLMQINPARAIAISMP